MDNLGSHKGPSRSTADPRRRRQAVLPAALLADPLAKVFAKLKTLLRKADPRTIETTWRQIGAPSAPRTNAPIISSTQDALQRKGIVL